MHWQIDHHRAKDFPTNAPGMYLFVCLHHCANADHQSYLQDPTPTVRGMVIQAIRFTFADSDDSFDEVLKPVLINMLTTMLTDPNLENRRLALSTLNSATQNKSQIILPHLVQLVPLVLKESRLNPDLVREVQMGPFKHKIDDGLELRKVSGTNST